MNETTFRKRLHAKRHAHARTTQLERPTRLCLWILPGGPVTSSDVTPTMFIACVEGSFETAWSEPARRWVTGDATQEKRFEMVPRGAGQALPSVHPRRASQRVPPCRQVGPTVSASGPASMAFVRLAGGT